MTTTGADNGQRGLPRAVVLLGWVSFFADVSSEMIYPLIPLFVVGVLGASAGTLGGIEGGASLIVACVTAWAGFRSDRRRRRVPYVRVGYGLPVIGKAMMALAFAWPMVLAGRLVDRFGKGLRGSPRDALIADATEPAIRGRAFGFHRAMDTSGALLGALAAAGLLWWFTGSPAHDAPATAPPDQGNAFRIVFGIAAALGLISLLFTLFVRESGHRADEPAAPQPEHRAGLHFPAAYWRTVAVMLVFSLANSSDAFLLLRARESGLSPWGVVLAYAAYNFVYAAGSYPAGVVSDRLGRWRVMALGWAIYAAVYAGLALTASLWPLLLLYGCYMALTDGVGKALVTDHAPRERRGSAIGVFYLANGIATLLASVVAGVLWDRVGPSVAFGVGAAGAALAVVLIPVLRPAR